MIRTAKINFVMIAVASVFATACGGGAAGTGGTSTAILTKLEMKSGTKDFVLDKNGVVYPSEMNFTAPGKPPVKTSSHYLFFASFETSSQGTFMKCQ